MTGSEMQEVVRIVTDSVMAAVERRISSLGVSVRPATVTQESPLMVRLDGAKTPAPARVSGELSVGSRVLVLSSGTTLSVIGGSDGGDVEVSDLAGDFVLPVSRGGTGATSASAACTSLGAAPRSAALMYKGTLSSANNMNSVTEPGIYYVGSSYPSNWCGISWAYVVVIAGSGVIHQLCVGLGPSNYYERHYSGSPATWQSWQRVISPYSLPAATAFTRGGVRVGSGLKVSGDVISVDNGAYVRSSGSYRVFVGSKNVTVSNTTPLLFNDSQYRAIVGRGWNGGGDCILAMNGNWAASHVHVEGVVYNPSTKYLCVMTNEATGAPMQVNYVIFAYNA